MLALYIVLLTISTLVCVYNFRQVILGFGSPNNAVNIIGIIAGVSCWIINWRLSLTIALISGAIGIMCLVCYYLFKKEVSWCGF
jgi:hypothetical protein